MCKRFLGAMLLALGIGLFGGWGSAQANSAPESTQSMLHVCWLKDAHVNPAACEVVRMPDAFEPAKAVVTSSVDFPDFQVVALDLREVSAEGYPVFNVQSIYYKDFLRATEPIIIVMRDSESFPRNGIAVRDSLGRERVFGIAISGEDGSLLLLVSATAMAASYGAYPYMRYGANGRDNASLHLIYTQSGIFASVVTYDLQDGNAPMFKGVGMLENGSLVLEDYSFDVGRHGEDTRYFGYGSQPLVCEARVQDGKQVVLLPTIDAREMGITKVSEPDIGGTYRFEGMQAEEDYTMAMYFLRKLNVKNTGLDLSSKDYWFGYGSRFAEDPNSVFNSYLPQDAGDYFGVYVYNKNDELVMTYYVHPNLWDAYRVTVDGEIKMLCSNDAMG